MGGATLLSFTPAARAKTTERVGVRPPPLSMLTTTALGEEVREVALNTGPGGVANPVKSTAPPSTLRDSDPARVSPAATESPKVAPPLMLVPVLVLALVERRGAKGP